jgi:hypothetical protein
VRRDRWKRKIPGRGLCAKMSRLLVPRRVAVAPTTGSIIPPDEAERIAPVARYAILDTPPDGAFDRLTRLAARIFGVPIATVSIVDHNRISSTIARGSG